MSQEMIRHLNEKRGQIIEQQGALLKLGDARTTEQTAKLDELIEAETKLELEVNRVVAHMKADENVRAMDAMKADRIKVTVDQVVDEKQKYADVYSKFIRRGMTGLTADEQNIMSAHCADALPIDIRGAQTITTTGGGYLIPEGFVNQIEEAMLAYGGVREVAQVITTASGNPLPFPSDNDTSNKGSILAINTAASDTDITFGQTMLNAYMYTSNFVKVPVQLAQDAAFNLDSYLTKKLGTRLARILNEHFTTGDGASKPYGFTVAGTSGVTTASASAITTDELYELEHSVDPEYRKSPSSVFMMADSTLKYVKKLTDGFGRPLWSSGLANGDPLSLLGYRYIINQDMAAITNSAKVMAFGDFSRYMIRDVLGMSILRLTERFADLFQVGYIAFGRHDGNLLDAGTHPIKYMTMHA